MSDNAGIRLFQTPEHPCGYWPERIARDGVLDPDDPRLPLIYGNALAHGYRRSGRHIYRPLCSHCQACVPLRIPTQHFTPNRSQRRCLQRNADLQTTLAPARRSDEVFSLYRRYLAARHPGGGMDNPSEASFDTFLTCAWSPTLLLEIRQGTQLLAVAVTDVVPDALSAVYTFYDPNHAQRSLGTYAILQQIAWARANGREHLYLGFWIDTHPKMAYKKDFQPSERLLNDVWTSCDLR